jgi:hypothetical protein
LWFDIEPLIEYLRAFHNWKKSSRFNYFANNNLSVLKLHNIFFYKLHLGESVRERAIKKYYFLMAHQIRKEILINDDLSWKNKKKSLIFFITVSSRAQFSLGEYISINFLFLADSVLQSQNILIINRKSCKASIMD